MDMFAETAIFDYCQSFADQGKQMSFSLFRFKLCRFRFKLCSKQTEVAVFRYFHFPFSEFRKHGDETWIMETWRHQTENGIPGNFPKSVDRFLVVRREGCRLSFVDEETNGSYPFANGLNGLNRLSHLCLYQQTKPEQFVRQI
jgi:hypothetical protein